MKYFEKIDFLPKFDLYNEYLKLFKEGKIFFDNNNHQICLNSTVEDPDNFHKGTGSLYYNWENKKEKINDDGTSYYEIAEKIKKEEDEFVCLCSVFKGTLFEEVYNNLKKYYNIGRVRLMKSRSQTCLSWHYDDHMRIHYPLKTQEGCIMIIQDEVFHMPKHTWWKTNTLVKHTAVNASFEERIHLVVTVLGEK